MNQLRRLALFFVLALVATACVKVDMRIDVADDGSAEVSGIVALNASTISDLAEDFGDESMGDRDSICDEFAAEQTTGSGEALESQPYSDGDFCGVQFSGQLSADEVAQEMGTLAQSDDFVIEERNGGWYFEMQLSEDNLGTGDLDGAEDFLDLDDLFGGAEYIIRVRLPGKQVDHNGVIESDGTVVWDLDLLNPPERIFLQTEPGERETGPGLGDDGGGSNTAVIIIVVLALLALAAAAFFLLRNKKNDGGDDDAQPEPRLGGADSAAYTGATPPASTAGDFAAPPAGGFAPPAGDFAAPSLGEAAQATSPSPPATEPTAQQPGPATADTPPAGAQPTGTEPTAPAAASSAPSGSPTPEEATGAPAWDPVRGQYVQWDPTANHWLVHDQASGEWKVE